MHKARFLHIADIPIAPDGFTLASNAVSNDGTGLFLYVDADRIEDVFATQGEPGGPIFPRTKTPEEVSAQLIEVVADTVTSTPLSGINVTFPFVDRFPDGRILVAGGRTQRYLDGSHDLNGLVFGPDGQLIRRILLGDGIENVACDSRGRIWASYFDEGIGGNFGWGEEHGRAPVGRSGLVCFDEAGRILWTFDSTEYEGEPRWIMDCYAMNVAGDCVSIFFYTDFDICQIDGGFRRDYCETELEGCSALAMHGNQVLLTGQYGDPPDTGYLGTMSDGSLTDVEQIEFEIPAIEPDERVRFLGRGSTLNVFHRGRWLQHDMALHRA